MVVSLRAAGKTDNQTDPWKGQGAGRGSPTDPGGPGNSQIGDLALGAKTDPGGTIKQSKTVKNNTKMIKKQSKIDIGAAFGGAQGRFAPLNVNF